MERRHIEVVFLAALIGAGCSGGDDDDGGGSRDAGPSRDAGTIGGPCESWLVDYSLDGSEFEIRGVIGGDRNNAIGPGQLTIRWPSTDERRVAGEVEIVEYRMAIAFMDTGIETDIMAVAGPDECGLASGTATSTAIAWSGPLTNHSTSGTVTCNGDPLVCAFAGLPEGQPVERNNTYDLELSAFALDAQGGFESDFVQVPSDDDPGESFIKLRGTETSSRCVPRPTGC